MVFFTGEVSRHHDSNLTNEVLAVGDGIETSFSGRSLHFPIKFGMVQFEYTIGATTYQVTDINGTFTNIYIIAGTIDSNGNYSFVFSAPPDNLTNIRLVQYSVYGLLSVILQKVMGTGYSQVLGTGNGVQTVFSGTLSGSKVSEGQCRLKFTINGVTHDLWDDGEGSFLHSYITTGTINYVTKAVNITFSLPIDSGKNVTTYHTDGNAGQDWISLLGPRLQTDNTGTTTSSNGGQREVVLKNSGISYKEEIIIGLREYSYAASDYFGISCLLGKFWRHSEDIAGYYYASDSGFREWCNYAITYNGTYNECSESAKFVISNDIMKYWLSTTKSRIIVVVRNTGTIYTSMYVGECIRFCSPSRYDKPQIVAASTDQFRKHSDTDIYGCFRPNGAGARWFDDNLSYKTHDTNTNGGQFASSHRWVNTGLLKKTTNGKVVLYPIDFIEPGGTPNRTEHKIYFRMEGIYHCPDIEIDSEHTVNTTEYIAFQDVHRTNYHDYFCIVQS